MMRIYKKILFPISTLLIMLIVLFVFPSEINSPKEIIIVMITVFIMLIVSTAVTLKKYPGFHDIYVLVNILIFFTLSGSGDSYLQYFGSADFSYYLLAQIAAAVILVFAGVFVLFRERIFGARISVFSGLDLIMIVFIILLISVQLILQLPGFSFLSLNLINGFSVYIWFKIFIIMMPKVRRGLFIFTFMLPAAMLLNIAF